MSRVSKRSSRRRFLATLAATSAAALVAPALALEASAADPPPAKGGAKPRAGGRSAPTAVTAAQRAEIEKQKRQVATTLDAVRRFELPTGSEPGFVFQPERARRARGRAR